jgi:hypothetical protein
MWRGLLLILALAEDIQQNISAAWLCGGNIVQRFRCNDGMEAPAWILALSFRLSL